MTSGAVKIKFKVIVSFLSGFLNAKFKRFKNREQLEIWQKQKFKKLQQNVLAHSRFYKIYNSKKLSEYPVINKKIHMDNFNTVNTQGLDRDVALSIAIKAEQKREFEPKYKNFSVGLSSGTSGSRGLFVTSEIEQAEWAGYIIGKMLPLGFQRQRVAFFLRANNNLYKSVNGLLIKFQFFDLIQGLESHLDELNQFEPTVLIAPAQVLRELALLSIDKLNISPKKIISVAEVLDDIDKNIIEQRFHQKAHQIYQCTEGFIACSCKYGFIHINEDIVIIEKHWLDKKSGRFMPVITDIKRKTQPVIRYKLDDILIENIQACPCGSKFMRISSIEGRCDDILHLFSAQGDVIFVYPDFIRNKMISSDDTLEEYQVIQNTKTSLRIKISPYSEELVESIRLNLSTLWQQLNVVCPNYEFSMLSKNSLLNKKRRILRNIDG